MKLDFVKVTNFNIFLSRGVMQSTLQNKTNTGPYSRKLLTVVKISKHIFR